MQRPLLLFPVFLAGCAFAQESLHSTHEQSIVRHVEHEYDRSIELLEKAVNINSGTMNLTGVQAVGAVFIEEFDDLGFDATWIDGEAFGRAGHVVATRKRDGPKILLIGHLDTVFPKDGSFQGFEWVDDYHARGPGVTDMKGGNVVMIQALRALRAANLLDRLSITAVLMGDEEDSGSPLSLARKDLIDAAIWADIAIGFEDGDGKPETAVVSRRGSTDWQLDVTGRAGHSSQVFQPDYGYGAIYEAARILDQFRRELSTIELLTFNPGTIVGGTDVTYERTEKRGTAFGKNNVISQSAHISGDIRAISPKQLAEAQDKMRAIVAEHLPMTNATLTFGEGYPPMAPSDGNRALLELFDQVSRDLGFAAVQAVNPRNAGAADISFTAEHVNMAIDGVGLMGSGGHTVNEVADIRTLSRQSKRVGVMLYRLSGL